MKEPTTVECFESEDYRALHKMRRQNRAAALYQYEHAVERGANYEARKQQ